MRSKVRKNLAIKAVNNSARAIDFAVDLSTAATFRNTPSVIKSDHREHGL